VLVEHLYQKKKMSFQYRQFPSLWQNWKFLSEKYSKDEGLIMNIFEEVIQYYSEKHRAYHNLKHIEALLGFVEQYKHLLNEIDSVLFTVWFHDLIYEPTSSKNEENSALLAEKHLQKLNVSDNQIKSISTWILASKSHQLSMDSDTFDAQFFLDIDLSILGADEQVYKIYAKDIRKEYKIYPNLLYKVGRKKVLQSFIEKPRIYKTELFFNLLEEKAKANLKWELEAL
jgi:predicted metal-dependent HD superfamily phosphohydrolase